MNDPNFGFEELELWKIVRRFKNNIQELTKQFPNEERFRLTDQIIRSSRSINALIVEGHGRFTYPDQIHFCIQARGSLFETINHLTDALDENYLDTEQFNLLKNEAKSIEKILNGYLSYLRKKRDEENTSKK